MAQRPILAGPPGLVPPAGFMSPAVSMPPSKRAKHDFSHLFEVIVGSGDEQQRFSVHHDMFTRRAPFFAKARSDYWRTSQPVDLTDDDPDLFSLYLHCVYTGTSAFPPFLEYLNVKDQKQLDDLDTTCDLELLIDLYFLADKFIDLTTANLAIDQIKQWSDQTADLPPARVINSVYARSVKGNKLRDMMSDYLLHEKKIESFKGCKDLDHEVLADFMYKTLHLKYAHLDTKVNDCLRTEVIERHRCYYHAHNPSHPMCKP